MLKEKIKNSEIELQNTLKAMQQIREQIATLNKKGEELAAKANRINGRIEALKEMDEEKICAFDAKVVGVENV